MLGDLSVVIEGCFQFIVVLFPDHMKALPCYGYRCGHCKKLAPEYEKLGSSFKKAKSVLIGKVSSSPIVLYLFFKYSLDYIQYLRTLHFFNDILWIISSHPQHTQERRMHLR